MISAPAPDIMRVQYRCHCGTQWQGDAIDVQEDILKHLKLNSHEHHQHIINTVWGDIEKEGGHTCASSHLMPFFSQTHFSRWKIVSGSSEK